MRNVVKEEMLKALTETSAGIRKIKLKYQSGATSSAITETNLWNAPSNGEILQDEVVTFDIDTSGGALSISDFQLLFEDDDSLAFEFAFEQIYNYPTNGFFNFEGTRILIS